MTIHQTLDLAVQHHRARRFAEAEKLYRTILAEQTDHPDALHLLGMLAFDVGNPSAAVELVSRAISVNPNVAEYHHNLGLVLLGLKDHAKAESSFRNALRLRPGYAEAHFNLGNALFRKGSAEQAIPSFRDAIRLKPEMAIAHNNLGNALKELGQLEETIEAYCRALNIKPDLIDALINLGSALRAAGQIDEAIVAYQTALSIQPDSALAHVDLAAVLLLKGEFRHGWAEFEWRQRMPEFHPYLGNFHQPKWDGAPLDGRRILLHAEQGFGDAIQFVRFVPHVIARDGKVILQAPRELVRLFQSMSGIEQVVAIDQALPEFDVHCPLLGLPHALSTPIEAIPAQVPYLKPEPNLAVQWNKRMPVDRNLLRAGLAWAGRPEHSNDRSRSISLSKFTGLKEVPNLRLFSLQRFNPVSSIPHPSSLPLIDLTADLADFSETAALIANLDLVISADTAVAHLAGALGKPVWVLLPFAPDWRWMLGRSDSPWYPTMRLFRQPAIGDWDHPIGDVIRELRLWRG